LPESVASSPNRLPARSHTRRISPTRDDLNRRAPEDRMTDQLTKITDH
jgi:hypothetical protein